MSAGRYCENCKLARRRVPGGNAIYCELLAVRGVACHVGPIHTCDHWEPVDEETSIQVARRVLKESLSGMREVS